MRNAAQQRDQSHLLREELDCSIARLPTRLRGPVILCYLEGHRQEEAARMLGCNQGTLSRRAADGLNLLRSLLARRGVVVTSAALAALLAEQHVQASVPTAMLGSLKLAATGGALSAQAGALADAMVKAGMLAKAKAAAVIVATMAIIGAGVAAAMLEDTQPKAAPSMVLVNFDGPTLPLNGFGDTYPRCDMEADQADGGVFTNSINPVDAVWGNSLQMRLTSGRWKAQFAADGEKGRKLFARDYCAEPGGWRFNTYNRLRFWIKLPVSAPPHFTDGKTNVAVGTYVKRVHNANMASLVEGGGSYTHWINVPAGRWVQVIVNMHPDLPGGDAGAAEPGYLPHPTGEANYNYFDALGQFFIEARERPSSYPADYLLDEMEFICQPYPENDDQIYSIAAAHERDSNRIIVTWNRRRDEDQVRHEVRYAFADIHGIGWSQAQPAPAGIVTPPGKGRGYSGMIYDTTALPLSKEAVVYIAIKPQNSETFSQVAIPLNLK